MSLNKFQAIGRLGAAPEMRPVGTENRVATFPIPLFRARPPKTEKKTAWVQCEVWNKQADIVMEYCKKGMLVYVEGELEIDTYEKDGQTFRRTYIRVSNVRFLDRGGNSEGSGSETRTSTGSSSSSTPPSKPTTPSAPARPAAPAQKQQESMEDLFGSFDL